MTGDEQARPCSPVSSPPRRTKQRWVPSDASVRRASTLSGEYTLGDNRTTIAVKWWEMRGLSPSQRFAVVCLSEPCNTGLCIDLRLSFANLPFKDQSGHWSATRYPHLEAGRALYIRGPKPCPLRGPRSLWGFTTVVSGLPYSARLTPLLTQGALPCRFIWRPGCHDYYRLSQKRVKRLFEKSTSLDTNSQNRDCVGYYTPRDRV